MTDEYNSDSEYFDEHTLVEDRRNLNKDFQAEQSNYLENGSDSSDDSSSSDNSSSDSDSDFDEEEFNAGMQDLFSQVDDALR